MARMIESGVPLPRLETLMPGRGKRPVLNVAFDDGFKGKVDLSGFIERHTSFEPLSDPEEFARAEIINFGGGVGWPCGLDLSAETLKRIAEAQKSMTASEFRRIQKQYGMTNATAAKVLGRTARVVESYRAGTKIPRPVAIAMRAISYNPAVLDAFYVAPKKAGRPKEEATT